MSAPVRTDTPSPAERNPRRSRRQAGSERPRSALAQRAYARRAQRAGRPVPAQPGQAGGRARFVLLVMALLAVGLAATLGLSTAAAADSHRVQQVEARVRTLTQHAEQLSRTVANLQTAPALARRARALGMVPASSPARLLVQPNGAVTVVGQPAPVRAPAPPAPPAPPPRQDAAADRRDPQPDRPDRPAAAERAR